MKHTKGPWKIDKVTPLTYSEDGAVFGAGNIKIKTPRVDVWYYEFSQKEEAVANAKLIAEATELLAALKRSDELLRQLNLKSPHAEMVLSLNKSTIKNAES